MNKLLPALALALCGAALAKIPAPELDEAAKAKAAEAAAKTAWQGKVDAYQLCKAQDRVAAYYQKTSGKAVPKAGAKDAKDAKDAKAATPPVAAASGTPVAAAPPAACMDPGPFAYTPPEQKPLESSGAHSPPGTASSPPSTKAPASAAPDKKS